MFTSDVHCHQLIQETFCINILIVLPYLTIFPNNVESNSLADDVKQSFLKRLQKKLKFNLLNDIN